MSDDMIDAVLVVSEIAHISRVLQRTGFPLELEISAILTKRRYEIYGNQFFEDNGKVREVDMEAGIPLGPPRSVQRWHFNPNVVIECKMSQKHVWVFHRNHTVVGHGDISHGIDAIALKRKDFDHLAEVLDLHYTNHDVASTFAIIDPKDESLGERDEIFDASSKLCKFVNYRSNGLRKFFDNERRDIVFYFPIIVFDGRMYEADFTPEGLSLKPIESMVMETRTISAVIGRLAPMYIDVVTKAQFEKHLAMIEAEVRVVAKKLSHKKTQVQLNKKMT
jgi:hypothetical protein